MAYEIIVKPSAQRDLDRLPDHELSKLALRIRVLSSNPRPFGTQKLSNTESYRIRSGVYRILYDIDDEKKRVLIFRIKHRKEAYR